MPDLDLIRKYRRTKYACFITSFSTAATNNLSSLLFLTFRSIYGLSYSLLGFLIVMNFITQLLIDLVFSFFPQKFPIKFIARITPAVMALGLVLFGLSPFMFPNHVFIGMALGTIVFSISGGLSEVLTSAVVAVLPARYPERELSRLHSFYAWGLVFAAFFVTGFVWLFGPENWVLVYLIFAIVPIIAATMFIGTPIPDTENDVSRKQSFGFFKNKVIWLCVLGIFLGGAAECTMSQWCSTYAEQALGISKVWGDIFGVALFGAMLGLGRAIYGKYGKNVINILIIGSAGAAVCYAVAALSSSPVVGLLACAITGFCVSMLWPGSLTATSERVPNCGVAMFAIMAAGGDLGTSLGPQFVGIIADKVVANPALADFAMSHALTMDQLAMKAGLAFATLYPILAIIGFLILKRVKVVSKA